MSPTGKAPSTNEASPAIEYTDFKDPVIIRKRPVFDRLQNS